MTAKAKPPAVVEPAELRHYTPQQAIDEFNLPVKEYTLRHWAYARKIPHNKLGGRITFTAADIRAISALFAVPAVADARRT